MEFTEEMINRFETRTNKHIALVKKWYEKIYLHYQNTLYSDRTLKRIFIDSHDASKYKMPEYVPYVYLTWNYYCKDHKIDFTLPADIKESVHQATLHHILNNAHHPEYWDNNFTEDSLSKKNRDEVPDKSVDATKMDLSYVVEMLADWLAMSEEKGSDVIEWADMNVNKRWVFTEDQVTFIYRTLKAMTETRWLR